GRRGAALGVPRSPCIDIEVCWLGADVREVHARLAIESHRLAQLRRGEFHDLGRRLAGASMAAEDTQRPGHRPGPPTRETGTLRAHPRFTLIRSWAAYVRIIVTSALSTRRTRVWTSFPAFVV